MSNQGLERSVKPNNLFFIKNKNTTTSTITLYLPPGVLVKPLSQQTKCIELIKTIKMLY